ncbi:uncharacterized protein BT62DRAFT_1003405 [Guyanagaster necrorhizus]|uniref:Uncharacterized protein n=1 Tax=Guyanagaster necrorhizus TaxID=856835 RepID=A0A9P7VYQ5_9AGAR|nr:uncharacterized protein BT62DRAFT_1003405 [Guyanagaster necrorhizus MCA 3950]KAG7448694.1 hypothetical protein BT62DRAFT_1003405 [Guyanagaster necrorhizus MCA 3950]
MSYYPSPAGLSGPPPNHQSGHYPQQPPQSYQGDYTNKGQFYAPPQGYQPQYQYAPQPQPQTVLV